MSSLLLTAPAVEPLSLAEAKAFLRVEHDDDNDVISALIAASRIHIEAQTRRALITQSWRIALDGWPADGRLRVRPAPLREVTAARVFDGEGNAQSIDLQALVFDAGNSALAFAPWTVTQPGRLAAGIELDVICGYGDAAADVPEPLRQAIRLLVAHWYENRGLAAVGTVTVAVQNAFKPLAKNLASGLQGIFGDAGGGSTGSPDVPTPFASGGVINTPSYFPLSPGGLGLAGEAGPEAIMPLSRGADGRLGIAGGSGQGANVTVQIAAPDPGSFRRSEAYITGQIARAVARGQRSL